MYKIQYQVNSPYIDLLHSKKKVFGNTYEPRSIKNNWRNSPGSTSLFSQAKKQYRTDSCEKVKAGKSQTKKKRNHTEAEQKLHQSLCVQMERGDHQTHHATKSLFYGQHSKFKDHEQSIHKLNTLFPKELSKKNKDHYDSKISEMGGLQNLQINDIDSLVNLIDHCVSEANEYISYLSEKLQSFKQQLLDIKSVNQRLQKQIRNKIEQGQSKDITIKNLQEQIGEYKQIKSEPYEMKKLLEVINKLSDQNEILKKSLQNARKSQQIPKNENNGEFYKQIHSKIDILNISIDNNKKSTEHDERSRTDPKRYKFIKPKLK